MTVVGALVAHGNPDNNDVTVDGETVRPGDLFLSDNTSVHFIEDFFAPDSEYRIGSPRGADVVLWMPQ